MEHGALTPLLAVRQEMLGRVTNTVLSSRSEISWQSRVQSEPQHPPGADHLWTALSSAVRQDPGAEDERR